MARILRRPAAVRDLITLWGYIDSVSSPEQADALLDEIERVLLLLAAHPLIGRQRHDLRPGLRSHPVGRYLVFYLPLEDGIDLIRVIYGGRDLAMILGEPDGLD